MNNTNNTNTIDYTHVRKLREYQLENIGEAIEAFTDFDFRKPAVYHFGGLVFSWQDFENITDSQERLYRFLDIVQAGMNNTQQQQAMITRECKECHKSFRAFANTPLEFCSYQCAEAYQFMLRMKEHYSEKQKTQRS